MALMEITVAPFGVGASLSPYVARAIQVLQNTPGIEYETNSMGTVVQGSVEQLLSLAGRMHQAVLEAGALRVSTTLRIDDRVDKAATMASKLKSLNEKLPPPADD
jgi:uncharacterized protein (TIGR00106 family)